MKLILLAAVLFLVAPEADAASLPGFRAERLTGTHTIPTSVAVDSRGILYFTTADGEIHRWAGGESRRVAAIGTQGLGNSGLLGMALLDDRTAVVHYTMPAQTHDVIATVDLVDGTETVLHQLVADADLPGRGTPSEHHGGNPTVAPDGTIFVGIGDYGWNFTAPDPAWNGGKIFRIVPGGPAEQFARGLRNPFDMAWDPLRERLIVADNGPTGGDEIHIIAEGADCGWPYTYGTLAAVAGASVPEYVFPTTVAPTGVQLLNEALPHLRSGILVGGFVSRSIYFFPDLDARPMPDPLVLLGGETPPVIDVAQAPDGTIYFATGGYSPELNAVYRLVLPTRGDCNGDGKVDAGDLDALAAELAEGAGQRTLDVHRGAHRGSWGCDADEDGFVTAADASELMRIFGWRRRAAGK